MSIPVAPWAKGCEAGTSPRPASRFATAHFLDNLRLARRISGEKMLSLIEQFYTQEKAFRITNNRGTPGYLNINGDAENDILRSKADFVIAEDALRATTHSPRCWRH